MSAYAWICGLCVLAASMPIIAAERQITFSAKNHCLDNNDNFSNDSRFLCYDTRETIGPGIDNCQSIEKVDLVTGQETLLYKPAQSITGANPAPGVGAASFSPVENKVVFIHGPLVEDVPLRGAYAKPNRTGVEVLADGSGQVTWLDKRDVDTARDTIPGAHRGGTHRHEYTLDGKRIGFTYDDHLLRQYDRTVGYMEKNPKAPAGATHYFAVLVPVVPKDVAKRGDLVKAAGDSWIGRHGLMRAFIGTVRGDDATADVDSLFVADVPADVDITTADSGSGTRYPAPPKGVKIRRLTHSWAAGTVRGAPDGSRIAYYGHAEDGSTQVFVIPTDGSDIASDPGKRPVQVTRFPYGAGPGLRWHPSGNLIFCISNNGVASVCAAPGADFGHVVFLTPQGDAPPRGELVVSPDGKTVVFTKPMPTVDTQGRSAQTYANGDFLQIFTVDFPDSNRNGIANAGKSG